MSALKQPNIIENEVNLHDFKAYLEHSLKDPFTMNLRDCSLIEVILACAKAKSKLHPNYQKSIGCLTYNLRILESSYNVKLNPVQITDVFWGYFIAFCESRGLKLSTIETMCNQLRSILNWAVKYNAQVSPTYTDFDIKRPRNQEIALTADEVSRITYFDIDRFYAKRRADYRETMHKVRDMFVLSCNLYQRHSDMVRIDSGCFELNIFRITQQKTGNLAVVNIDRFSIEPKTTYRILEKYEYRAPYTATIGNYNSYLHQLMHDVGLVETVRIEERRNGKLEAISVPKWKLISSHTARRTAITVNVLRGHNVHDIRRCSGHTDLRVFDNYVRDY
jgi:hypothetical protein